MEYENIIYEVDLLGGSGDLCYRRYLLPLQSGRFSAAPADPGPPLLLCGFGMPAPAGNGEPGPGTGV